MTSLRSSFPALPRAVLHRSVVKSVTLRTKKAEDMFSAFTMDFGLRKERKMNLSYIPPYISLLCFDFNISTPNKPQPICIILPCVALG